MTLHDEVEQRALEIFNDRDAGRCVRCEHPVSLTGDGRCPNCGNKSAAREDDLTDAPYVCEDCDFAIYDPKSLKRCPMCKGKHVRRAKVNVTSMPSTRTHPYACKKCGNPFTEREARTISFCDCGSREVIDRRRTKNNPAAPVGFSCQRCWTVLDPRAPSCGNCGCAQAVETVVSQG